MRFSSFIASNVICKQQNKLHRALFIFVLASRIYGYRKMDSHNDDTAAKARQHCCIRPSRIWVHVSLGIRGPFFFRAQYVSRENERLASVSSKTNDYRTDDGFNERYFFNLRFFCRNNSEFEKKWTQLGVINNHFRFGTLFDLEWNVRIVNKNLRMAIAPNGFPVDCAPSQSN